MYGVKWAYFDLDGTLIPHNQKIANRTIMALMYLQSKGIKIGIATGRSYFFTQSIANKLNVDLPIICVNGSWIVKKENFSHLYEEHIDFASQTEILRTLNEKQLDYMVYTTEGIYSTSEKFPFYKRLQEIKETVSCTVNYEFRVEADRRFYKNLKILKILTYFHDEKEKIQLVNLVKEFKDVSCASSQKNILDIFSKNADKSIALKMLMQKHNIKHHEIIVFGDNENDIKMFELSSKSVALANASEKVKRYAKRKTDLTCEEEGVADFIFRNF